MNRRAVTRRVTLGTVVLAASAAIAPAAAAPGINGADLLVLLAPAAFLAAVWPCETHAPAEGAASPSARPLRTAPSAGSTTEGDRS